MTRIDLAMSSSPQRTCAHGLRRTQIDCSVLEICLRVIAISPSWTVIVWRHVASRQVTCAAVLQFPVVSHRLKVLHAQPLGNQVQSVTKCEKKIIVQSQIFF